MWSEGRRREGGWSEGMRREGGWSEGMRREGGWSEGRRRDIHLYKYLFILYCKRLLASV